MAGKGREWALRKLDELPAIPGTVLAAPLPWPDDEEEDTMGNSVDIYYGNHCAITDALIKAGCNDAELLDRILGKFGTKVGDVYFILNNEHSSGSPMFELDNALEIAFDQEADGRFLDVLLDKTSRGISYADASEVCAELGIPWPETQDEDS